MAATWVQDDEVNAGSGNLSRTLTGVAAGNAMLAWALMANGSGTITSITDDRNDDWVQHVALNTAADPDDNDFEMHVEEDVAAGDTVITGTFSGTGERLLHVAEVSSSTGTLEVKDAASTTAASGAVVPGSLTIADATTNVLFASAYSGYEALSTPTSFTQSEGLDPNWFSFSAYRLDSGTGAQNPQFQAASTFGFVCGMVRLEDAAAGGATPKGVFGLPIHGPLRRVVY